MGRKDYRQSQVHREFGQNLTARPAGAGWVRPPGRHGDGLNLADPCDDGPKDGHPFSADGEAEGGVFHVSPGVDPAVVPKDGGPDGKSAIGAVRPPAGRPGRPDQAGLDFRVQGGIPPASRPGLSNRLRLRSR